MKIGILGGGQLGRMLALAGYPLNGEFTFLDPSEQACAAPLGRHLCAAFDDARAIDAICDASDVLTYEFENVPAAVAETIAARRPLYPSPAALHVSQDRLNEKKLFDQLGIPVPKYLPVAAPEALELAAASVGLPAVLKTRRLGYDGKGQAVLRSADELEGAFDSLGQQPLILEGFVEFERELSCIAARGRDGQMVFYPVVENLHEGGILRRSTPIENDALQDLAESHVRKVCEHLDYVGVLAFEFFVADGLLLANEIAPRVHNSGHWTIEGAETSQFENHLRAISGLPLGSTALRGPCQMINFIGDVPDTHALTAIPGLHVHHYGKSPKPLRKVGHVTITAGSKTQLQERIDQFEALKTS